MTILFTNNAVGSLASSITDSDLTLTLQTGEGLLFPSPGAGEFFYCTLVTDANVKEIVKCTSKSSNTLTIVRAQDDTDAMAFTAGDRVELRVCAASLNNFAQLDTANEFTGANTFTVDQTFETDIIVESDVVIDGAAGADRFVKFRTGGEMRWGMGANTDAESTAEAGSNWGLYSYDDNGAQEFNPILVNRATGITTLRVGSIIGADYIDHYQSGTKVIYRQTAAPTGWTKQTDFHDAMLRFSNTTLADRYDASSKVTDLFTSRTIAQANLPNVSLSGSTGTESNDHTHQVTNDGGSGSNPGSAAFRTSDVANTSRTETSGGLSATHTHAVTVSLGGSGTAMNFSVNYVDVISASKV